VTVTQTTPISRLARFDALFTAHQKQVLAYAMRRTQAWADAEDVAAETFTIAWRKLPRRIDTPLPWLYAVAGNVLSNHRRKQARRDAARIPATGAHHGDPADLVGDRGLAHAFAQLSERDREAIRLVAWEGLSTSDAARAAGCTVPTFAVRLSRARRRLQRHLDAPALLTEDLAC
jgi:RNA polymerase sigma-70 factor, ECF subfamily